MDKFGNRMKGYEDVYRLNYLNACLLSFESTEKARRSHWVFDTEIPIFSKDRRYLEQYVYLKEEKA